MDNRVRGHKDLLDDLRHNNILSKLLLGVITQNEAVSYTRHNHMSVLDYDTHAAASAFYFQIVAKLIQRYIMPRKVAI